MEALVNAPTEHNNVRLSHEVAKAPVTPNAGEATSRVQTSDGPRRDTIHWRTPTRMSFSVAMVCSNHCEVVAARPNASGLPKG
ncbi:hypothetical protein BH24CHL2_BH24CHL2_2750 [soil metagenome]